MYYFVNTYSTPFVFTVYSEQCTVYSKLQTINYVLTTMYCLNIMDFSEDLHYSYTGIR